MEQTGPPDPAMPRPGVSFDVGGDARVEDSAVAGRDLVTVAGTSVGVVGTSLVNSSLVIRNQQRSFEVPALAVVAAAAVLLLVLGVGVHRVTAGSGIDTDVVFTEGATGARETLASLKRAERSGDAAAWCAMAQPGAADCVPKLSAAFERAPESYRAEIDDVDAGDVTAGDGAATAVMRFRGERQGTVHLEWSRNRWQVNPTEYVLLLWAGGLYLSIVDAAHGNGPLDGLRRGLGGG